VGSNPSSTADPPYYLKDRELYPNHYTDVDHRSFAEMIQKLEGLHWVITYVPRIRELYAEMNLLPFTLRYSAHRSSTEGRELLISPPEKIIPAAAVKRPAKGAFFRTERALKGTAQASN
jgi:hypothetical protein